MPNITITQNNLTNPILEGAYYRDETLTLAAAGTILAGTILARSTSTLKLVLYVKGGSTNGNGIPCAILPYTLVATASGDVQTRVAITGKVRRQRLVIAADGTSVNIDGAVVDQLRNVGFTPISVSELNIADNS
jgi:hypothetical protein